MASKKLVVKTKNKLLATLVTGARKPCAFCKREVDDEAVYGKLYAIGDIQVHYFCALLSCCLVQRGRDSEGLFGFLYHDILAEVERSKKHKCSYCNTGGAGLGCTVSQCRKQFHLPCGREKNAVSLFYGNYKSFCQQHAPKQKIPEHIMAQARIRMKKAKAASKGLSGLESNDKDSSEPAGEGCMVCVICYEAVEGFPSPRTFWPPCCARDAWFHRECLQRMALSAGMHYLKCPLCNDKDQFYDAVVGQGFYVPDRDAAWELEQNAFAEIYERVNTCSAETCLCPQGRNYDADTGPWDIQLCLLCGTLGRHAQCGGGGGGGARYVCAVCAACAPPDLHTLAGRLEQVIQEEQRQNRANARRPIMPSRMSLRRTKARNNLIIPSTSRNDSQVNRTELDEKDAKSDTTSARLDLNLRTPRRPPALSAKSEPTEQNTVLKPIENTMFSPTKLVEERLSKKIENLGVKDVKNISPEKVITKVKEKLRKPRPLSVKKKIVNAVLDQLLLDIIKDTHKHKEWRSPKKTGHQTEQISEQHPIKDVKQETTMSEVIPEGTEGETFKKEEENDNGLKIEDDSSNSTFQLPSEFIADHNSDDSLPLFETAKKLTTVDIQKDSSLEISENNEVVNINVVTMEENCSNNDFIKNLKLKSPVKTNKSAFKFNPIDKETLVEDKLDMDVESFKNFYLNEVDREFQCSFKHKHEKKKDKKQKLRTAIDFAVDATKVKEEKRKKLKRKLETKDGVVKKQMKKDDEIVLHYKEDYSNNIKVVCSNDTDNTTETIDLTLNNPKTKKNSNNTKKIKKRENLTKTIDLTVKTTKTKKRLKKIKNKKLKENIQVKIKFRKKQFRLQITQSQTKNKKSKNKKNKNRMEKAEHPKKLKQCILQYADNASPNKVIVKPEIDVTPKKRNYVKLEKSPDALIQTSIQSFFKKVPFEKKE